MADRQIVDSDNMTMKKLPNNQLLPSYYQFLFKCLMRLGFNADWYTQIKRLIWFNEKFWV